MRGPENTQYILNNLSCRLNTLARREWAEEEITKQAKAAVKKLVKACVPFGPDDMADASTLIEDFCDCKDLRAQILWVRRVNKVCVDAEYMSIHGHGQNQEPVTDIDLVLTQLREE